MAFSEFVKGSDLTQHLATNKQKTGTQKRTAGKVVGETIVNSTQWLRISTMHTLMKTHHLIT